MRWRWPWARAERREGDYTGQWLAAQMHAAEGRIASGLAAVEACCLAYRRATEAARVDGPRWAVGAVEGALGQFGDDAARTGQYVALIESGPNGIRLTPASISHVHGGADPDDWIYTLTVEAPTASGSRRVRSEDVVHVRWSTARGRPWQGISPLTRESRAPSARLLSIAHETGEDTIGRLRGQLNDPANAGSFMFLEEMLGEGGLKETRPTLDAGVVNAHEFVTRLVAAAHGVPVQLVLPSTADGTAQREAFRRWFTAQFAPFLRCIEAELRLKVHDSMRLDARDLRALDMQGSARALKSLADAGFSAQQAAAVVGLMDEGRAM